MLSTIGSVGVTFVAGAMSAWGPKFIYDGLQVQNNNTETYDQ